MCKKKVKKIWCFLTEFFLFYFKLVEFFSIYKLNSSSLLLGFLYKKKHDPLKTENSHLFVSHNSFTKIFLKKPKLKVWIIKGGTKR